MSDIISFYDWYLSQRNRPKVGIFPKGKAPKEEPKDIEEEE